MGGARRRGRHRCAGRWITAGGGSGGRSRLWFGELVGLLPVSIEEVKGRGWWGGAGMDDDTTEEERRHRSTPLAACSITNDGQPALWRHQAGRSLPLPPYGSTKVVNQRRDAGGGKMDRRLSSAPAQSKSMLARSKTGDFDHNRCAR
jgi:hypothetical protein